jgi:putative endopeptidase
VKRFLLTTLSLSLACAFAQAAPAKAVKPAGAASAAKTAQASGIDPQYIDEAVRPQDDFFVHFNGKWLAKTEIPADKARWGGFEIVREDIQPQLKAIIEEASTGKLKGAEAKKIGDLYASYMDEKRIEALGTKPLAPEMARIAALKDKAQLAEHFAHNSVTGLPAPMSFGVSQDAKDSTRYAVYLGQSGLGLPDRDYYLKLDDPKMADTRAKYEAHVARMLTMAGNANGAADAKAIVALETELAKVQWTRVENRDPVKRYNRVEVAKLNELMPGFDWNTYLKAAGVAGKTDYVVVSQPSYMTGLNGLIASVPLDTWKAYFQWHLVRSFAAALPKSFVDENFAFYGTVLTGVTEQRPRWKRGVGAVEGNLGEAVGKLYVQRHFPAERKARMQDMIKNLLAAYKQSIDEIDWMSPETKKQAQAKLAAFTPKIGYPDKWRDFSGVEVKRDDLVGNLIRLDEFNRAYNTAKLGKPIDKTEWGMTPQTVNAYYRPTANEIVFPAAILQPPFFDPKADDAVNYGGIGAVIGHEISHGFDDSGSQYDGTGNLRMWWTKEDNEKFKAKTKMLVEQYNAFSPVPGYNVNGSLTLGENIADNSGLAIAYKAYKISLKGKPAPVINGLTGDQRFFMGWGQVWRSKAREENQISLLKTDPHSPGQFRTNGTLRNQPAFYEAFGVKPGDKMYLAPEQRVIIW